MSNIERRGAKGGRRLYQIPSTKETLFQVPGVEG
jgi:hypothetical protein